MIHIFFQLILKFFIQRGKISTEDSEIYIFLATLTAIQSFCNMIQGNGRMNIDSFRFQSVVYKVTFDGKQLLKLQPAIQIVLPRDAKP